MKTKINLSVLVTAVVISVTSIHAQTLLNVAIDSTGTAPSGFSIWNPTAPNNDVGFELNTTNFGSIDLALNASTIGEEGDAPAVDSNGNLTDWGNGIITRERNPINTISYGSMYQGFVTAAAGGAVGLELSGLADDTTYSITFYSYDENGSRTSTFTDYTGGEDTVLGSITYSGGNLTYDGEYSLTATVTTDSSGQLVFGETEPGNAPVLNGFTLQAVPEPGAPVLAGLGGLSLLAFRRRK